MKPFKIKEQDELLKIVKSRNQKIQNVMKKLSWFLMILFVGIFMQKVGIAQESIPEPEFSKKPYFLKDGKLESLERVDASLDIKMKGMGYGGTETFYKVFSTPSPVRFSKENIPVFYIKLDGDTDPAEVIVIVSEETKKKKKGKRRFKSTSTSALGKSRDVSENQKEFSVKKIKQGLYEISIPNGLESGEYALLVVIEAGQNYKQKQKISCFGID